MGFVERFASLVVRRPAIMLTVSGATFLACGVLAFMRPEKPAFDQAQKGFEARGTGLAGRVFAASRGLERKQCAGVLSLLPLNGTVVQRTYERWAYYSEPLWDYCRNPDENRIGDRRSLASVAEAHQEAQRRVMQSADAGSGEAESPPSEPPEPPMPPASPPPVAYRVDGQPMCTDEWIMNEDHSWVPLVFEAKDGDLLSVETIHDICALDLEMRQRDGLCVALPHACPRAFRTARPHVHASTALSVCRAQ